MTPERIRATLRHKVPEFTLTYCDPVKDDFGQTNLSELKDARKWTILFFYPADFTFV